MGTFLVLIGNTIMVFVTLLFSHLLATDAAKVFWMLNLGFMMMCFKWFALYAVGFVLKHIGKTLKDKQSK